MSGHSKWSTIKRKKEKTDSQRAKIFTKMSREISVAVKESGADPSINSRLRDLITKARSNNVPNDNIERVIKKAAGDGEKNRYENIIYEGYGPNGVAIIVDTLTDNRNRTAGDLRHYFDKFGGNLGQTGCVSFMFTDKGMIAMYMRSDFDQEKLMNDAMDAGANDIDFQDEFVYIYTLPYELNDVKTRLQSIGYRIEEAQVEKIPSTYVSITDVSVAAKLEHLLDMLDDNDDVQNVWHNWSV